MILDIADGRFLEFAFDTFPGEDGAVDSFAFGRIYDDAGGITELEPGDGAVGDEFVLGVPLMLEGDRFVVTANPPEATVPPEQLEVTAVEIVLFSDGALATYKIPIGELEAALTR